MNSEIFIKRYDTIVTKNIKKIIEYCTGNLNRIKRYVFKKYECTSSNSNDILPHKEKNRDFLLFNTLFNIVIKITIAISDILFTIKYGNNPRGNQGVEIITKKMNMIRLLICFIFISERLNMI